MVGLTFTSEYYQNLFFFSVVVFYLGYIFLHTFIMGFLRKTMSESNCLDVYHKGGIPYLVISFISKFFPEYLRYAFDFRSVSPDVYMIAAALGQCLLALSFVLLIASRISLGGSWSSLVKSP
ncbi:hypothetical protein JXC34_01690, partial [Candidatus Woesearchaeota archaeon]|nr:hypothetical protein [Candidatus Woesearchaeota archaeon]